MTRSCTLAGMPSTPPTPRRASLAPLSASDLPRQTRHPTRRLPALTGLFSVTLLVVNTLLCFVPIVLLALVKLAVPTRAVRRRLDPVLNGIATYWISCNTRWIARLQPGIWTIHGNSGLRLDDWYLVNCNHQTWVDIFVLQAALNKRIPLLKFFLKQQLLYVPFIGLAWWALDFPFMKRYSKAQLRRKPQRGRQDQETARRACQKFRLVPTSVMVFAEGTRFSEAKRIAQSSPYRHLLKPRAGALATTLSAMGDQFRSMIDATIVYPDGVPSFWDLACGRAGRIVVMIRQIPIPQSFCGGDYGADPVFRADFHHWLAQQWEEKDRAMAALVDSDASERI
ncbi:Acyltransferase [Cupriavidus sp. H18C2]